MTDATEIPVDHTPSNFGGVARNPDGTIVGWQPPGTDPVPSRADRVATLLADMTHAMMSNAPVTPQMLADAKDLLGA